MLFNAFLITFLYNRLGRSETRGAQVIFSNQALVSVVDGQVRFQLRLFDADAKHPVVEAHVRLYVVMKNRPVPRPLRLLQPDDELGGMLFLSFPTVVSHHIDLYSLLHPPSNHMSIRPSGLILRQVDGWTAGRDDIICPVCGESYGTMERLRSHVRYAKIVEARDNYPTEHTHLSLNMKQVEIFQQPTTDLEKLKVHFQDHVSEVIAVVEGIDPIMSGTFQSLHSFRFEDIVWDAHTQFAPCMEIVNSLEGRFFQVDLDRYHDLYQSPAPPPTAAATNINVNVSTRAEKTKGPRRHKQTSLRQGDSFFSTNTMTLRKAKRENKRSPRSSFTGNGTNNNGTSATTDTDSLAAAAAAIAASKHKGGGPSHRRAASGIPMTTPLTDLFQKSTPSSDGFKTNLDVVHSVGNQEDVSPAAAEAAEAAADSAKWKTNALTDLFQPADHAKWKTTPMNDLFQPPPPSAKSSNA
jgi:hypothetical protein